MKLATTPVIDDQLNFALLASGGTTKRQLAAKRGHQEKLNRLVADWFPFFISQRYFQCHGGKSVLLLAQIWPENQGAKEAFPKQKQTIGRNLRRLSPLR